MRKVFYSFHYARDAWRAGQVRNYNTIADEDEYGVIDSVEWEKIKRQGRKAIENWIQEQLNNTSVTVVLIGTETSEREWVEYEIRESWDRGNALFGIRIHNVKDQHGKIDPEGKNPFDQIYLSDGTPLSSVAKTYDWVTDDGRKNMGIWAEEAFQRREKYSGETKLKEGTTTRRSTPSPVSPSPTIIRNPSRPWAR